ncbi:hypothetical protein [Rhodoferax mekongensis]|uniref:Uncharacterized protein n=1 Tax=Rhodoferax mekongensis TaxID=3068341 RepID=A0ABZ0AZW0_9BURK|nr:hypothetical protein [Rhodoferax sp. TBRC 17307]WNO05181.1 hypothetical protein RAN89_01815 [Rhodoferax sp. TBRC 17307]
MAFSSILVNCDSSWDEFSCGAAQSGIPHSGEFAAFCKVFANLQNFSGRAAAPTAA